MTLHPEADRRLDAVLRDHAARLDAPGELRARILASAPGHVRRLDAVLAEARRLPVSALLARRILAAAPQGGIRDLLASLWPFAAVWRPAGALVGIAALGIFLGTSEAVKLRDAVSINGALSEEVFRVAFSVNGILGSEEIEWLE
jgi:hypothetical protein